MRLLIFISIFAFPIFTFGQLSCPRHYFRDYKPEEPTSIYDLPDSIRIKLETHLIDYLGEVFYSMLIFKGGEMVDLEKLYEEYPSAKNFKWTPYSYYLCFALTNTGHLFDTQIVLDKFGNVIEEIGLPNVKKDYEKESLISTELAEKIAKKKKCYDPKTRVSLDYNAELDIMVWHFEGANFKSKENNRASFSILILNAHNGKVIVKKKLRNVEMPKRIPGLLYLSGQYILVN